MTTLEKPSSASASGSNDEAQQAVQVELARRGIFKATVIEVE
jgi:hypothetical protein